ncbi:transposase, partial [bacterium]|nr:transposase [bacterium]
MANEAASPHPLLISLAETGEPLRIVNRSGNRPSHEGAAAHCDDMIALLRDAGFRNILLRGDTDYSQTEHLDRWDEEGIVFHFGYDARPNLVEIADGLEESQWKRLKRPPRYRVKTKPRAKPERVKENIVVEREFQNIVLKSEDVAEFDYRPAACKKTYRMIVVRKNLSVEKGENVLFDDIRYFFYITNDRDSRAAEVVFSCNHRCNQENLVEQLANGPRAFRAPLDNLYSNWAYMLMASLAWTLKAWAALWLPETGRWKERRRAEKRKLLRMEFRTFVNTIMRV